MRYKYNQELPPKKIAEDTIGTAPACVGATSRISKSTLLRLPTQIAMALISPRSVIKYFSGEDGAISELCFDGSDDDLGMEDEDPYDPMDPLHESDNEGTQNCNKIFIE